MTTKEINEGNKLIAQFLGYQYIQFNNPLKIKAGWWHTNTPPILKRIPRPEALTGGFYLGRSVKDLKYHSDWNQLIPIVKKCMKLIPELESKGFKTPITNIAATLVITYDPLQVFEKCVAFIQWYNQLNSIK
jgi:hypothetical protein